MRKYMLLGIVLLTGIFLFIHSQFAKWKAYDEKLTALSVQFESGQSREQVSGLVDAYRKDVPARLDIADNKLIWELCNPSEWGAQERILHLEFDSKGVLIHRRLRTADSETVVPSGAPPDF